MTFTVRVALPADYAAAGLVTAQGYHADDLLRRPDGLIDADYEAQLTDAGRRAREADLLVAIDDGQVLGTVTWCPPTSPWRELATRPDQAEFRMLSVAAGGRRRGVGRALVEACLDRARADGMSEVLISSLPQMTAHMRSTASSALFELLTLTTTRSLMCTCGPSGWFWRSSAVSLALKTHHRWR